MREPSGILAERGFSLIEMLVALVIMSLSLGVLYQAVTAAVRNVAVASQYTQATMLAESILAENSFVVAQQVSLSGAFNDYVWELSSWPVPPADVGSENAAPEEALPVLGVPLQFLQVRVLWAGRSDEREVELLTIVPLRELRP
jgi:general secretion pathway protein I